MQQVKIGLTPKLRSNLDKAAKAAGRTLSEECRLRLDQSTLDDQMTEFARVAGREVAIIAQIVQLSTMEKRDKPPTEQELQKLQSTIWRAMVVAVNDYFANIKPQHFSKKPLDPPPTQPDVRADAIGHAAAQGLFVWASGKTESPYPEISWMFKHPARSQEE
jgi:hypothetical protein